MRRFKQRGETIGFVPTMGALHEGHLRLVRRARKECDRVVVSIFVNPLQFGPREDLKRYPRDLRRDEGLLRREKVDLLFFPSVKAMYPDAFQTTVQVDGLSRSLCGAFRPGHFEGVATVCTKLFHLVQPDTVYFGEKDFQQSRIIARMLRDLNFNIRLKVLPTVREKDGLAMSSRNRSLAPSGREKALSLSKALFFGQEMIQDGERCAATVTFRMRNFLRKEGVRKMDYVSVVHPDTLEPIETVRGRVLLAIAAHVGKTRLIDNLLVRT